MSFSDWAVPDFKRFRPDMTSFPGDAKSLMPSVRSESLNKSLTYLQPWLFDAYDCTVMVVAGFHDSHHGFESRVRRRYLGVWHSVRVIHLEKVEP